MWMVPISICTSDDPTCAKMQILMDKPELTLVLKDIKPDQWVKVSCHKGEHNTGNKFDCHCNVPLHLIFLSLSPLPLAILYFLWRGLSVLLLNIGSSL